MPLTALRELTLPTQKALTSRDQKTFLARSNYSIEVGLSLLRLLGGQAHAPRTREAGTVQVFCAEGARGKCICCAVEGIATVGWARGGVMALMAARAGAGEPISRRAEPRAGRDLRMNVQL